MLLGLLTVNSFKFSAFEVMEKALKGEGMKGRRRQMTEINKYICMQHILLIDIAIFLLETSTNEKERFNIENLHNKFYFILFYFYGSSF